MQDDRPPVYWEDVPTDPINSWLVIRASAIGHPCLWELVAHGQGLAPTALPEKLHNAFREGHELEPEINRRLSEEYGVTFDEHQTEGELIFPQDKIMIRFHPDGIGWFRGRLVVIEDKALSDPLWQTFVRRGMEEVIAEYPWQLSVMMHARKLPGLWVGYNKGGKVLEDGTREKVPDQGKMYLQPVAFPPVLLSDIRAKAVQVKELVIGEDLTLSTRGCDDPTHFPCQFLHIRPEPEGDQPAGGRVPVQGSVLEVDSDSEEGRQLDADIQQYLIHHGAEVESGKLAKEFRDRILSRMKEGVTEIRTGKFIVPIRTNTTTKIHWDELEAEVKAAVDKVTEKGRTKPFIQGAKRRNDA